MPVKEWGSLREVGKLFSVRQGHCVSLHLNACQKLVVIPVYILLLLHILWICSDVVCDSFHLYRGLVLVSGIHWRNCFCLIWHMLGWDCKIVLYDRSFGICSTGMGHSAHYSLLCVLWSGRILLHVVSLVLHVFSSTVYIMRYRDKNRELLCCRFSSHIVRLTCLTWIAGYSSCFTSMSTISAVTSEDILLRRTPCSLFSVVL